MSLFLKPSIYIILFFLFSCCTRETEKRLKFILHQRKVLDDIPSASGIENFRNKFYLISDDSPWLFIYDSGFTTVEAVPIWDSTKIVNNRILKSQKPDFEAITSIKKDRDTLFLIFGSGSTALRKNLIVYNVSSNEVIAYSLGKFYDQIVRKTKIKETDLNIEAAVSDHDFLYLLNRGNNFLVKIPLEKVLSFIGSDYQPVLTEVEIFNFQLPHINGVNTGFSGATISPDFSKLVFTASAEKTVEWSIDGEVIGSLVGIIALSDLKNTVPLATTIKENGQPVELKIESLVVKKVEGKSYSILMVSDNDMGGSEIIEGELKIN